MSDEQSRQTRIPRRVFLAGGAAAAATVALPTVFARALQTDSTTGLIAAEFRERVSDTSADVAPLAPHEPPVVRVNVSSPDPGWRMPAFERGQKVAVMLPSDSRVENGDSTVAATGVAFLVMGDESDLARFRGQP